MGRRRRSQAVGLTAAILVLAGLGLIIPFPFLEITASAVRPGAIRADSTPDVAAKAEEAGFRVRSVWQEPGGDEVKPKKAPRRTAKGCTNGCETVRWSACDRNGMDGPGYAQQLRNGPVPQDLQAPGCAEARTACLYRGGGALTEVFFRESGNDAFVRTRTECAGGRAPMSEQGVGRELHRTLTTLVPAQKPGVQPKGRALINIPTIFYAGQPATLDRRLSMGGTAVQISATASFAWRFEPGVVRRWATPGGPYPAMDVTYTYTKPGRRQIVLETTWRGSFQVGGGDWRPIPGVVTQRSTPLSLTLVESRPQLVAPD